jgi:DUF4097 and DUF4098 domain-containing protein YvlB
MKKMLFFCIVLIVGSLSACVIAVVDYSRPEGRWMPKSSFHETLTLKPGGTVSLENARGNIDIEGWDEEKVEISAQERRGYPPPRRLYVSTWRQPELKIQIKESPDSIDIETDPTIQENEARLVNYVLRVPQSIQLQGIRNKNGDIRVADLYGSIDIDLEEGMVRIENFSGSVDILLGNGDVEAELLDLRQEDEIRITTRRGDIRLYLEPQAEIRLEASAPRGSIVSDFDLGKEEESAQKTRLSLSALNGDIRIKKRNE